MAHYTQDVSRTFGEYLLIPGYTSEKCFPSNVSLKTPLVKFKKGEEPDITLNIPLTSAIMQSVSDDKLAVALAREGGLSFIFGSQSIEDEAAMVARVKGYKAGYVSSDSNLRPDMTLKDVLRLKEMTGHSTMAVTADGTEHSELLGIVTSRDYRVSRMSVDEPVSSFMTPFDKLITASSDITLSEANDILWEHKLNSLPLIDSNKRLKFFVFRKDYEQHKENFNEILDKQKRYLVGAGINTRDYTERVPALVKAGADALCIDSSEGYTEWQKLTIDWIRKEYGSSVKIGAGNVVDKDGFRFLAEAGADFIKVGIGGGAICITREQKGIGRGQASSVIDVCEARNEYFKETGVYIPLCSDGGIVHDYHITLALAMGADFVMLGRYFARFDEAPGNMIMLGGTYVKEYWGEGTNRARNWQRYDSGGTGLSGNTEHLAFEEGVDSYVPYAGPLKDNVDRSLSKVRSTMCNCGCLTIPELQENAKLTLVSSTSIVEGSSHDVILKDNLRNTNS
ncbi:MAG: IMP dehydrogenase [Oscillospiraceae bacterium]|jgi:IMP dehydrogenase|nr:IMP dehydrogenase [Oscillospiraceae bacterium]